MKYNKENPKYKKPKEKIKTSLGNFFINFGKKLADKNEEFMEKEAKESIIKENRPLVSNEKIYESIFSEKTLEKNSEEIENKTDIEIDKVVEKESDYIIVDEDDEKLHICVEDDNVNDAENICVLEEKKEKKLVKKNKCKNSRLIIVSLFISLLAFAFYIYFKQYIDKQTEILEKQVTEIQVPKVSFEIDSGLYEIENIKANKRFIEESVVNKGESLGHSLERVSLPIKGKGGLVIDYASKNNLLTLVRPGDKIISYWNDQEKTSLNKIEYCAVGSSRPITIAEAYDGSFWHLEQYAPNIVVREVVTATINTSLWEGAQKVGLDANAIMAIAKLLESEIDLLTDIKKNDSFRLLFHREYSGAEPNGPVVIEMLEMNSNNKNIELYRHQKENGEFAYYDVEGRSTNKAFLITPLQYTRISSKYTLNRMHPIHKVVKPHQGVDYAAPTGTPVSAVADGVVEFSGWSGGYGKLVVIKHGAIYTTMYAHLSRIDSNGKKGKTVKQGDVIGYVGATGTATGPHLDFRLKRSGVFVDPLPELAKQEGAKLSGAEMTSFTNTVTQFRTKRDKLLNSESTTEVITPETDSKASENK